MTNVTSTAERFLSLSSTRTPNGLTPQLQVQHRFLPACDDRDLDATLRAVGFESLESLLSITRHEVPATAPAISSSVRLGRHQRTSLTPWQPLETDIHSASTSDHIFEYLDPEAHIPRGPSASFQKQTWWDSLLSLYSDNPSQSAVNVYKDLNFLWVVVASPTKMLADHVNRLNKAIYWLSFINCRRFMDNLYDPDTRIFMQPSLVLSALALSTLMKSSEAALGEDGRRLSFWLRDAAQSSLDASISASWIEPSLAQAAFVSDLPIFEAYTHSHQFLAVFEASSHPTHSIARTASAIGMLDSLIQALHLTTIDAHEPTVTTFRAEEIPRVGSHSSRKGISGYSHSMNIRHETGTGISQCTCGDIEAMPPVSVHTQYYIKIFDSIVGQILDPTHKGVPLMALTLNSNHSVTSNEHAPLEAQRGESRLTASWPEPTDIVEIQKEENRRLCWSSIMLISALREYTPLEFDCSAWDLHVTKHENVRYIRSGPHSLTVSP
jgi:hypothetical protein